MTHDLNRTARLQELGWRVLRLSNGEVLSDESAIIGKILQALQKAPSP